MDEKNETGPAVEPKQEQQCKQARPHDELICELLDSRRPKTEREHAAVREIERLRHDIERHIAIASEYATECERLRAELAECIVALEKIANPISAMKRALPVGATLNGAMATTLSNDPNYLKEIAKAALAARKGEGEV